MAKRKVEFQYTAKDAGFQAVSKRVGNTFDGLSRRGLSLNNLLKIGAGTFALTQVTQGLGALTKSLVNAFTEQEDAVTSLNAALAATGKSGQASLATLTAEASKLQQVTRLGDEAILKASASLATLVPSLDVNGLKNAQTALVALADTFFEGNLDTAALQLGKTLGSTHERAGPVWDPDRELDGARFGEARRDPRGREVKGAFEVAQARATTLRGSMVQTIERPGRPPRVARSVVVESLNLTSINQQLTARVARPHHLDREQQGTVGSLGPCPSCRPVW